MLDGNNIRNSFKMRYTTDENIDFQADKKMRFLSIRNKILDKI